MTHPARGRAPNARARRAVRHSHVASRVSPALPNQAPAAHSLCKWRTMKRWRWTRRVRASSSRSGATGSSRSRAPRVCHPRLPPSRACTHRARRRFSASRASSARAQERCDLLVVGHLHRCAARARPSRASREHVARLRSPRRGAVLGAQTRAPFAATSCTSRPSRRRPTPASPTTPATRSRGAAAATSSTLIASLAG